MSSGEIGVNNLASMNDLRERELHQKEMNDVFALCFCNSNTEKIPMWYLYSGIFGKGMRMGITPSRMLSFIKSIDCVYPVKNNKTAKAPIFLSDGIDISFGWVYFEKYEGTVYYRNKMYEIDDHYFGEFKKENYFIKDYPWEYEKEFRIIFHNHTGHQYNKIAVKIPEDILSRLKLTYAPEVSDGEVRNKYSFKRIPEQQIKRSALLVKMNLMDRNKDEIVENIGCILDDDSVWKICSKVKKYCDDNNCRS